MKILKKQKNQREQLNILCDVGLSDCTRMLATSLKVPYYTLFEHLLQLALAQITVLINDEKAKKQLEEHLVNDHLCVPQLGHQRSNEP